MALPMLRHKKIKMRYRCLIGNNASRMTEHRDAARLRGAGSEPARPSAPCSARRSPRTTRASQPVAAVTTRPLSCAPAPPGRRPSRGRRRALGRPDPLNHGPWDPGPTGADRALPVAAFTTDRHRQRLFDSKYDDVEIPGKRHARRPLATYRLRAPRAERRDLRRPVHAAQAIPAGAAGPPRPADGPHPARRELADGRAAGRPLPPRPRGAAEARRHRSSLRPGDDPPRSVRIVLGLLEDALNDRRAELTL